MDDLDPTLGSRTVSAPTGLTSRPSRTRSTVPVTKPLSPDHRRPVLHDNAIELGALRPA